MRQQNGRRRRRNGWHSMMFCYPEALVTKLFGADGQRRGGCERLTYRYSDTDPGELENR
jgi:uncharacterized protein Veg